MFIELALLNLRIELITSGNETNLGPASSINIQQTFVSWSNSVATYGE